MERAAGSAAVRSLAFAVAFLVAVLAGRATVMDGTSLSLVWPAAGVAALWLLVQRGAGTRRLDLGLLGVLTLVANAVTGAPPWLAVAFVVANVVQVLVLERVLLRWAGPFGDDGRPRLTTLRHLGGLVASAVVASAAGAVIGPVAVALASGTWSWTTVAVWMCRNVGAIVLTVALGLHLLAAWQRRREPGARSAYRRGREAARSAVRARVELVAVLSTSALAYVLAFRVLADLPVAFPLLGLTVWVALRFSSVAAAVHDSTMALAAVVFTLTGTGPFALIPDDALRALVVQVFVAMVGITGQLLALGRDEREALLTQTRVYAQEAADARAQAEEQTMLAELVMAEVAERAATNAAVLASVDVGIVMAGPDGRLLLFNETARRWHGLEADASVDPRQHADRYHLFGEDGRTPLAPAEIPLALVLRDGQVRDLRIVIARADGTRITVSCNGRTMAGDDGSLLGAVVAMHDLTAELEARADLADSEQLFRLAFDDAPVSMMLVGLADDEQGTILRANDELTGFTGRTTDELVGSDMHDLTHPDDRVDCRTALGVFVTGEQSHARVEKRYEHADGSTRWGLMSATVVQPEPHRGTVGAPYLLCLVQDITARKRAEQELQHQAEHDRLTGLANRARFDHVLEAALLDAPDRGERVELVYLDLDDFKPVNDTHGHAVGDLVLQEVARRLQRCLRAHDQVARLGGDEFAVVLTTPLAAPPRAAEVAARIAAALEAPVLTVAGAHRIGASLGTTVATAGESRAEVVQRADAAMYEVKRAQVAVPHPRGATV
ncbi:hypothetical protein GCM10028777_10470 [Angustibacter speluncae]